MRRRIRGKRVSPGRLALPPSEIADRLEAVYGPVEWRPRMAALEELVFTVLTQHTSDLNAERAYRSLRRRYPTWPEVMGAPSTEVASAIREGGLANQKSVRIQRILGEILERRGELDLNFLSDLSLSDAKAWLRELPGVGPKTAAVVLSFSLGMPAMPVDTHIHRVSGRLGLIGPGTSADDAHEVLEGMVAPDDRFAFHVLLITHGRRRCKARRPLCGDCPLYAECPARPGLEAAGS